MTTSAPRRATILLAHGSSDPNWLMPFEHLTSRICAQVTSDARVELAYMELAEPTLEHQVEQLHQQGYTHIDVLPLFFAAGRHLRKDVPAQIDALMTQLDISISLHPPVGLEPEVASAISQVVLRQLNH